MHYEEMISLIVDERLGRMSSAKAKRLHALKDQLAQHFGFGLENVRTPPPGFLGAWDEIRDEVNRRVAIEWDGGTSKEMSLMIVDSQEIDPKVVAPDHIGGLIRAWLAEHAKNSARTAGAYANYAEQFRTFLQGHDLDVLLPPGDVSVAAERSHKKAVAYHAQAWAAQPHARTGRPVSASTHNLRLAAIASFYEYAIRHDEYTGPSPLDRVQRMKRNVYNGASPLAFKEGELDEAINAIPADDLGGLRDRAMLSLTLWTGRRLSEIADLRCGAITPQGGGLSIEWKRTKGGKEARNILPKECPAVGHVKRWLARFYGSKWPSEGLVFMSLSRNSYGHRMTPQGVEWRCNKWLGTHRFHRLRHTFAAVMLESGASAVDLQHALGHSSLGVTSVYIENLNEGENEHIAAMRDVYAGKKRRK